MHPDDLQDRFRRLTVWKANDLRAPHKPLLTLWAIGRCLRGEDRMVSYRDTREALTALLKRFGPPRKTAHPEHPFWRLRTDGVWEVPGCDRISVTKSGDAHVGSLLREDAHGGFPEEIDSMLRTDVRLAVRIACSLLDAHFPPTLHDAVMQAVGIDPGFEYIRRRPRDRAFSNTVLAAYGHRCVVCDFAIRIGNDPVGLEAAHIRWHCARGPDLVSNALSLCVLHHRLFDAGAFTLSPDRRVVVSERAAGAGYDDTLGRFRAKSVILPADEDDGPDPDFLQWHHQHVFGGRLPVRG